MCSIKTNKSSVMGLITHFSKEGDNNVIIFLGERDLRVGRCELQ